MMMTYVKTIENLVGWLVAYRSVYHDVFFENNSENQGFIRSFITIKF